MISKDDVILDIGPKTRLKFYNEIIKSEKSYGMDLLDFMKKNHLMKAQVLL